jgi:Ca-activated chloride channel homolog
MQKQLLSLVLLLSISITCFSCTQITIEGKVFDENKNPLIAASVLIKGTSLGATTDFDGKFILKTNQVLPITLVVSYIGYETKEIILSTIKKPVEIFLNPGATLDQVVIVEQEAVRKENKSITKKMNAAPMYDMASPVQGMTFSHDMSSREAPNKNTEDYDAINENRFYEVSKEPLSTFSIDVDAASYSNMRRFIQNGQKPPKDAVRIEEMVNYFNYQYPQPQSEHPFEVVTEVSDCPWNKDHRLFHIGLQGKKIATENLPASNLVFLIDVSGSMSAQNKLPLLQSSFKLLVDQLREQDKVAIVVYAGAAGAVLPSTSGADKQKIKEAIMNLSAGGSTAGAAGINLAYQIAKENFVKGGNNRVILATDGDFNVGTSSDGELTRIIEQKREDGIFLTVMGFGTGNYKDNKMQKLADSGNGNHAYIDNISEARKVLVNEFGGTLFTIAKDVKLQLEFNPTKVKGYRLIGYENRILQNEDFNDDKKDAGELGSGHTVTAIYEIIPAGVESEFIAKVDDLKYQKPTKNTAASKSPELLTIKLRYKKPDGNKSMLIEKPVLDTNLDLEQSSDNFRWSAAVAGFGMLLRDSQFKKDATYDLTIKLAKGAKGSDENGYRAELIRMMEDVRALDNTAVGMKK